jgi:hypothetical protein
MTLDFRGGIERERERGITLPDFFGYSKLVNATPFFRRCFFIITNLTKKYA